MNKIIEKLKTKKILKKAKKAGKKISDKMWKELENYKIELSEEAVDEYIQELTKCTLVEEIKVYGVEFKKILEKDNHSKILNELKHHIYFNDFLVQKLEQSSTMEEYYSFVDSEECKREFLEYVRNK